MKHTVSAPGFSTTTRFSDDDARPGSGKEQELQDAETGRRGIPATVEEETAQPPAAHLDGLRNRRENGRATGAAVAGAQATGADAEEKPKKEHKLFKHVQPKTPFTVGNQLQRTILNSWINILLLVAPVGIALNYVHSVNRIAVFVVNFIAIIPLAAMLSFATEEIALRTGETLGGLLNATFGYVHRESAPFPGHAVHK